MEHSEGLSGSFCPQLEGDFPFRKSWLDVNRAWANSGAQKVPTFVLALRSRRYLSAILQLNSKRFASKGKNHGHTPTKSWAKREQQDTVIVPQKGMWRNMRERNLKKHMDLVLRQFLRLRTQRDG